MNSIILLFVLITTPEGATRQDVSVFGDRDVCEFVAQVLNEHKDKPKELSFGCRVPAPREKA